jgi:hypothetical protein
MPQTTVVFHRYFFMPRAHQHIRAKKHRGTVTQTIQGFLIKLNMSYTNLVNLSVEKNHKFKNNIQNLRMVCTMYSPQYISLKVQKNSDHVFGKQNLLVSETYC